MSGRVNLKPDEPTFQKQNSTKRTCDDKKRFATSCRFRVPKRWEELSPVTLRFLKNIREKMTKGLLYVSKRRTRTRTMERPPPNSNSTSSGRSNPLIAPIDSHRVEAINDCIQFINSSSSFQRSNTVSSGFCPFTRTQRQTETQTQKV